MKKINFSQNDIYDKYYDFRGEENKKSVQEICYPKKYTFQISQKFIKEFFKPDNYHKKILLYHNIGSGKTCTSIQVAENFIEQGYKIIVVLPASLKGNYYNELMTPCGLEHYVSIDEYNKLKQLDPESNEYQEILYNSYNKINKKYTIYSYNVFFEKIDEISLENTLLIIDEVHNVISEKGTYYSKLYKKIQNVSGLYMITMTATPIYDKPVELALLLNLLNDKNKIDIETFDKKYISYTKDGPILINSEELSKYMTKLVSYYRGPPDITYPKLFTNIVECIMSENQKIIYSKVLKGIEYNDIMNVSNNFLLGIRMASNIVYPNKKFKEDGFESLKDKNCSINEMKKLSCKFVKLLKLIEGSSGTLFIYTNFKKYGGIYPLIKFLNYHGFKDYETTGDGNKRYAIWSGDQKSQYKETIKAIFNKKENVDGSKIKLIIGSSALREGVSFLRLDRVIILEPYWNMSRLAQIIGRGYRYCAYKDLPEYKRRLNVYILVAVHPAIKQTVDQRIYELANEKEKINTQFLMLLKNNAIDCKLFKKVNNTDTEKIKCNDL